MRDHPENNGVILPVLENVNSALFRYLIRNVGWQDKYSLHQKETE